MILFVIKNPSIRCICFNSRPREGSDMVLRVLLQGLIVSIHAPARGATILLILT